jgi:peptidoglycan/LPS O-acetylase OafA/YrhL
MLLTPTGIGARILQFGPLVGIGRISYGLYLFHVPMIRCFDDKEIGWEHPANTLLVMGLSIGVAVLSYLIVERPCLRLKDRFRSRGSPEMADLRVKDSQPRAVVISETAPVDHRQGS